MMNRASKNRLLRCSVAAAALLSFGTLTTKALAQDNGSTTLEEVIVEGGGNGTGSENGGTGPVKGYVAKETTAGSKTATAVKDVPQAVSVVGREEIDDRGAQKVDEALRYTAGVFTQPFGADSDTNWVYIRGFDATQTGVYQDGLQLFGYGFGAFFIDSFTLERIEVLKGPASVLYGGSNPGGVTNYVSKRPTEDSFTRVEAGIDSFGVGYVGFDVDGDGAPAGGSDGTQGGVDYRVVGRLYGGGGYFENEDQFRGVIAPSVTWSPDAATSLTVLANYTHMNLTHGVNSFLPYQRTVFEGPFGRIPRDFNSTEPDLDDYDRQQFSAGYEFSHEFDNGWTFRQNARAGFIDINEQYLYTFDLTGNQPTVGRINFAHDTDAATALLDNQIEGKFATGAVEHTLLAGLDYKYYTTDTVQSSGGGTAIDPTDPDYGQPQGALSPYLSQELDQSQLGFYVQDQLRFGGGWLVTLNGRYDQVWTDVNNRPNAFNANPADFDPKDRKASGRAGIAYEFENGFIPYASVATFFNPLIGSDATTLDALVPEEGEQYEVGVKYAPDWFDGIVTVSLFDLTRRNVVTPGSAVFSTTQLGEVQSRGFEAEAKFNVTDSLRATAAVTAFDLEITDAFDPAQIGKQPFLVPETQASLFLDYTFHEGMLDGFTVGGGVRYQGSSAGDRLNTFEVPSATLADAKIGYKKDNWGVDLVVTNLFDKRYVASCQVDLPNFLNNCAYGETRKALLKANFEW